MSAAGFLYGYVGNEESYGENEYIIKEGSRGDWVYLILKGQVKVKKMTSKGMVTIDTLKEGDIFGEMALWQAGKTARSASVIADGPVIVGVLRTELLLHDYDSISPRLKNLMKSLMIRLTETTKKAAILAVEQKI
jgi:CRP-like cAMP-binding protein